MKLRSLSSRLLFLSLVWTIISLALILAFVVNDYRQNSSRAFNELLTANLYNLMGSAQINENGKLGSRPNLGDPRFISVNSGWYWSVQQINKAENQMKSPSLVDQRITSEEKPAFNATFQRTFQSRDAKGNSIQVIEARAFLGDGDRLFSFMVAGNLSAVEDDVDRFTKRIAWLFVIFALGLAGVSLLVVRYGLMPLKETSAKLAAVRNGEAEQLNGEFPSEIAPLIDETNELIKSNRRVVERARTQVGNLAHGLKTPIAVIRNELTSKSIDADLVSNQIENMHAQIQTYLDRARISAQSTTAISRTLVEPVAAAIQRVMAKLNPDLNITLSVEPAGLAFAGEKQDLEEILGNLAENAARFAKSKILISAKMIGGEQFVLTVEDDGNGMSDEEAASAIKRGTRLDETMPGSGLGLSIVADITQEYRGNLELRRSDAGGLAVRLILPARN